MSAGHAKKVIAHLPLQSLSEHAYDPLDDSALACAGKVIAPEEGDEGRAHRCKEHAEGHKPGRG